MVFIGKCMTGFVLLANYHLDLESLLRKLYLRLSSIEFAGSCIGEIVNQDLGLSSPVALVPMTAAWKRINDF
jgi:hypothetical protein